MRTRPPKSLSPGVKSHEKRVKNHAPVAQNKLRLHRALQDAQPFVPDLHLLFRAVGAELVRVLATAPEPETARNAAFFARFPSFSIAFSIASLAPKSSMARHISLRAPRPLEENIKQEILFPQMRCETGSGEFGARGALRQLELKPKRSKKVQNGGVSELRGPCDTRNHAQLPAIISCLALFG